MGIATLIVDHDQASRHSLTDLLGHDSEVEIVGECADMPSAVDALARLAPALVFLDADLPGHDALDIVGKRPAELGPPLVVFLAEHDGHARRAFDVRALDYLVRPVNPLRLRLALSRAREQLSWLDARRRDRVLVKVDGRVLLLRCGDIDRVESAGNYLKLHVGSSSHMVRQTMAHMERELGTDRFVRIHRSHLVNIDRIVEFCPLVDGDYAVMLLGGTRLTMSRGYRERVQHHLGQVF